MAGSNTGWLRAVLSRESERLKFNASPTHGQLTMISAREFELPHLAQGGRRPRKSGAWIVAGSLVGLRLVAAFAPATELYVSTTGHDAGPGTRTQPFATLERARDAIRQLQSTGRLAEPVTVHVRGGRYYLSRILDLAPRIPAR